MGQDAALEKMLQDLPGEATVYSVVSSCVRSPWLVSGIEPEPEFSFTAWIPRLGLYLLSYLAIPEPYSGVCGELEVPANKLGDLSSIPGIHKMEERTDS